MSKKSILKGTIILTITGLSTKLLGFYYRIFLTNLIGVKELGIYQLVFPIYILMFAFSGQGFCLALTKHVSYYLGKHQPNCTNKVLRFALFISVGLSILVSCFVYQKSSEIATYILKNIDCAPLLRILCIAIPFVVFKALLNAYLMGTEKPKYQGITQLLEQIIRILAAIILSYTLFQTKKNATLAVIAVVIGELCATIITIIFYLNNKLNRISSNCSISNIEIQTTYLKDALPMTTNNLIFSLFSSFEAILMPTMLYAFYSDKTYALELFGIISGIVLPFLLFPATITTSLSSMLLPAVSYADATKDYKKIKKTLTGSVFFCLSLGICASLLYLILGNSICSFAFHSEIAGKILCRMSFLCPFIYLSGTLAAIMNGMNLAFANLAYNLIGISIRIACSMIFVPQYGITAYICGVAISYVTIDAMQYLTLRKHC